MGDRTQLSSEAKRGRKEEDTGSNTMRMGFVLAGEGGKEETRLTWVTENEPCHPAESQITLENTMLLTVFNGINSCNQFYRFLMLKTAH